MTPGSISETALFQQLGILFAPQLPATAKALEALSPDWRKTASTPLDIDLLLDPGIAARTGHSPLSRDHS